MKKVVLFTLFVLEMAQLTAAAGFGYESAEQEDWKLHHKHCAGKYQSPISIDIQKAIPINIPAVEMIGYHNLLPGSLKLSNNGHSVALIMQSEEQNEAEAISVPYIFGGALPGEFEFDHLHFHWADENSKGSEHVLNGIRYPMEMHLVHRNRKYGSVTEALGHSDGLAVLGFFYQLQEVNSHKTYKIARFVRHLEDVREEGSAIQLNFTLTLASLLEQVNIDRFYTYIGSLTTPPCSQSVTWTVYPDPLFISLNQLEKFRALKRHEDLPIGRNYRLEQPLNHRRIFLRQINRRKTHLSVSKVAKIQDKSMWIET